MQEVILFLGMLFLVLVAMMGFIIIAKNAGK